MIGVQCTMSSCITFQVYKSIMLHCCLLCTCAILQVYIEACFREALRLHPPVGNVSRDVAVDTTIKGENSQAFI